MKMLDESSTWDLASLPMVEAFLLGMTVAFHSASALNGSEYGSLLPLPPERGVLLVSDVVGLPEPASHVRFVHLNVPTEHVSALFKELPNLMKHAPGRLVGDAEFAFKLLRGNPASRACHEIDGVKPQAKRRGRILEDRPDHRVLPVSAELAGIRGPLLFSVVFGYPLTGRTVDAVWVAVADQPIEARRIVRELPLELEDRVAGLRSGGPRGIVSVGLGHTSSIAEGSTAVKYSHGSRQRPPGNRTIGT